MSGGDFAYIDQEEGKIQRRKANRFQVGHDLEGLKVHCKPGGTTGG